MGIVARLNRLSLTVLLLSLVLAGCGSLPRQAAPPPGQSSRADISGLSEVRYYTTTQSGIDAVVREIERQRKATPIRLNTPSIDFLSISGGGDNGAFAAGLLNGWTVHGSRPSFQLVTGVSTGALIAPFAFLGSDYDDVLREVYTTISPEKVYRPIGVLGAVSGDSYADTSPLYGLISQHVDLELLRRIAYEYNEHHRWLVVATTNMDEGMPVVWNMGKIASVGTPQALDLFRNILLASAAIPAAFPPVMLDVTVDGKPYQEMHADGGVTSQAFLYPPTLQRQIQQDAEYSTLPRRVFIIRNSRLLPEHIQTERSTTAIAGRAISQLIHNQGLGDLYRMYLTTRADGLTFNLAYIRQDFEFPHRHEFDSDYVKALYDYGYEKAVNGYPWRHAPPGVDRPAM